MMTRSIAAAAALAVLAGCGQGDAQEKAAGKPAAAPAVAVTTITVAPRTVPVRFEAVGRTEGSREVQVRARVAGILEAQLFREGDAVKAGAPLFRIEQAPYEIETAQARAALAQETARLELARQELERLEGLADRRAISRKEADLAASTARQSEAAAQMAQARLREAELNLSYTTVRAPIGGVTGRALQSIGTLVQPAGESALLTTLTRDDPIWVRFALSEAEYARLRAGEAQAIEVRVELADGREYAQAGRLNFAGSTVDEKTGTVQMRAELPNARGELLAGQYVRVRVLAGSREAIVVPQAAVLQDGSGRYVFVADAEGKAAVRPIRAGAWLGGDWVVLEGLKAGEAVIVDNLARLRPGTPVKVLKAG
jgi:membrane fusion protein (multidrug efflux system)